MIPAKMTSKSQDLQYYLQAPQNWSPSLPPFCLHAPILAPIKNMAFISTKNLFLKNSQHDEIVQFCIKIENFYIILKGSHIRIKQYQRQFTKQGSFCEILVFVILSYALENIEELFF